MNLTTWILNLSFWKVSRLTGKFRLFLTSDHSVHFGPRIIEPAQIHQHAIVPIIRNRDFILQAPANDALVTTLVIGILQRLDPSTPGLKALIVTPTADIARMFHKTITTFGRYMKFDIDSCLGAESMHDDISRISAKQPHILIASVEGAVLLIQNHAICNTSLALYCAFDGNELFPSIQEEGSPRDPRMMVIRNFMLENTQKIIVLTRITKRAAELMSEILHCPITLIVPDESVGVELSMSSLKGMIFSKLWHQPARIFLILYDEQKHLTDM